LNDHALEVLELREVLVRVASRASSSMGREAILSLRPSSDRDWILRELERVAETVDLLDGDPDLSLPTPVDARTALTRLALPGSVLEGIELHAVGLVLEAGRVLANALQEVGGGWLELLRQQLFLNHRKEDRVRRTVEPDGSLPDSASPELRRIRVALRKTRSTVVRKLEQFLQTLPERYVVPDASVTLRNGRYAIPVRREGRAEVGGIVHDESASGVTLFVEPPLAIQIMNRIRELERDEEREVRRILQELTDELRVDAEALQASLEALVDFDTLHARARIALDWGGFVPDLLTVEDQNVRVVQGRHPLLAIGERPVVPFDLDFDAGERVLIVSGPNAGGKTVFLKAFGLISVLTQSGVVPPVGAGTRLPVFADIFADIGDEQSIAESLSTFSAHVANLREILERAGPACLVLLDELGTGTDPEEGAALARAIIEELHDRGALTLATSHLGSLKRLAEPGSGMVNASLQFDPDRIEPTFVLVKGRPGRSYGLSIARRMGLAGGVVDRAEGFVCSDEARVEKLLESLERRDRESSERLLALTRDQEAVAKLRGELEEHERSLRERERSSEQRAREEARRFLLKARSEVEAAIRDVRNAREESEIDGASRSARRRIEAAVRRHDPADQGGPDLAAPVDLSPGDLVRLSSGGARGMVVEVREGRATIESEGLRIQVPVSDLRAASGSETRDASRPPAGSWVGPSVDASTEVDLRGLRVEEVEPALGRALDGAVLSDLPELRVIHGKGTGALRERVADLLKTDPRVKDSRIGQIGEGGSGVTIVRFK
jgi:DNA mismatch repair protein MutS2